VRSPLVASDGEDLVVDYDLDAREQRAAALRDTSR